MYASIPTTYVSLIFCMFFFFFFFFLFLLPLLPSVSCSSSPSLFIVTPLYIICRAGIFYFYPFTTFGSLWVSFQDCPLACRLPSHYLYSECVGCTTLHFQTKLLVLFLPLYAFILLLLIRIQLSLSLITYLYGMHPMVLAHIYLVWVRCHPSKTSLPKEA